MPSKNTSQKKLQQELQVGNDLLKITGLVDAECPVEIMADNIISERARIKARKGAFETTGAVPDFSKYRRRLA